MPDVFVRIHLQQTSLAKRALPEGALHHIFRTTVPNCMTLRSTSGGGIQWDFRLADQYEPQNSKS